MYALRSAEVYMCLEQNVVFICQLPPKTCRYVQNLLPLIKALYLAIFYIGESEIQVEVTKVYLEETSKVRPG